ncbi:MAG: hypothetical protein KKD48_04895 [Nanoarchaeota archaeon]|nr:hypothetical protein [Nanoarchaeota archaeon]
MKRTKKFWDIAFNGVTIPETHKTAIIRIYESYPIELMPNGICDPVYILNIFCKELGIGDGKSNFYKFGVV